MNAPTGSMALIRANGRILFASTHFCKLVGVSHSKVAGMSCFDFVFPEDLDAARQLFQTKKADRFSFRLKRMDGAPVWVDIQLAPMKSLSGKVYAISAAVTAKAQIA
jgi:PAS domain S-box-containing protein